MVGHRHTNMEDFSLKKKFTLEAGKLWCFCSAECGFESLSKTLDYNCFSPSTQGSIGIGEGRDGSFD